MKKIIYTCALFAVAVALLIFFATYRLSEAPRIWYDEGYFTQTAENLALYGRQAIQIAPGEFASAGTVSGGYPFIAPIALSYKLFGIGVLEGRSVMVLFIVGFFLSAVYLVSLLFGTRFALWSAFFIASFPMLYGDGKTVLGEVPGLFYLFLTLIALVYLERSNYRSLKAYAAAALLGGFCVATKPIFILLLPAVALVWLFYRKHINVRWDGFGLAVLVFIAVQVPWFLLQFGINDSFANILTFYANPYEVTNLTATVLTNILLFVTQVTPVYTILIFVLWGGSVYVRRRTGTAVTMAETVGFAFGILVLLAFLRMPGWYRYLFPALMAGLPFLPFALSRMWDWVRERVSMPPLAGYLPCLVLTVLIVAQTYQSAHSSFVAMYYNSHTTRDLSTALVSLTPATRIFIYNVPEAVVLLPSRDYYQYIKPHPTIGILGAESLHVIANGNVDYILMNTGAALDVDMSKYHLLQTVNRYSILKKN